VRRLPFLILIAAAWLALIGAGTQIGGPDGWPPQSELFKDARTLALATPFLMALGMVIGIVQARRAATRNGGDAILGDKVRRHDVSTVSAHWLNAVGAIIGLATGAMLLGWVGQMVEYRTIFILHYIGAAMMLYAIFNHWTRHGVSGGTGLIPKSLIVIRDLIGELLEYAGLFGPKGAVLNIPWPKAIRQPIARYVQALLGYKPHNSGKYLATEKILSYPPWTIIILTIVGTGLIKVARYVYPVPAQWVATATTIHDLATIALGVMLVIHLLPLLLIPANYRLLFSMFTGKVPLQYVKERHPQWYKALLRRMPQTAAEEAAAAPPAAAAASDASSAD
jgi:cytochrome b subunit of formate dehydrogenase